MVARGRVRDDTGCAGTRETRRDAKRKKKNPSEDPELGAGNKVAPPGRCPDDMEQAKAKKTRSGRPFRIKKKSSPKEGQRLTMREISVAELLAQGLTNKQIGSRLDISEHTVKFHVNNTMRKTGAQTRAKVAADFVARIRPEIEERFECSDESGRKRSAPVIRDSALQDAGTSGSQGHQNTLATEDRELFVIIRSIAMRLLASLLRGEPPYGDAMERAKLVEKAIDLLDAARAEQ